ncbi:MAG: sugar phosphate nucleotidyltransferase [Prevotellaceae bacterium]|nr:sugar phosphate nucleotidyltransferase [Prevotellaceae bacterium]
MKQAMIFAAGMGTRLKPLTDVIPKALVPVGDKPLLQIVLERLIDAGIHDVVVNVHHKSAQIINFLKLLQSAYDVNISVSDESDQLLETGGGIRKAGALFKSNEPILIHNVDILSNVDLAAFYDSIDDADAMLLVSERKTKRYLLFDDSMHLVGWTNIETGEVKSPYPEIAALSGDKEALQKRFSFGFGSDGIASSESVSFTVPQPRTGSLPTGEGGGRGRLYAFSGIHAFSPSLFSDMETWPEKFPIMDFYLNRCAERKIKGYLKTDLKLLDVGKLDTLANAEEFMEE